MEGVVEGGVGENREFWVNNDNDEKSLDENLLLQEFARFVKDKIGRPLGLYLKKKKFWYWKLDFVKLLLFS